MDENEKKNYTKVAPDQYVLTEGGIKLLKDNMQIVFELMQNFSDRLERLEERAGLVLTEHEPLT